MITFRYRIMRLNSSYPLGNRYVVAEQKSSYLHYLHNQMTEKKKALIEAICDAYGFDYPETDQEYEAI